MDEAQLVIDNGMDDDDNYDAQLVEQEFYPQDQVRHSQAPVVAHLPLGQGQVVQGYAQAVEYEDMEANDSPEQEDGPSPTKQGAHHHHDDEEGLGEDFEDTPWVPPSLSKAAEYRHRTVFRGSTASMVHTNMCRAPDLGNGTVMYFQFMRSMGVCMFVMTLLSVPTLFFSFWGTRMPLEDQDSFYFYRFALGNIGYNKEESSFESYAACQKSFSYYNANETCISLPGNQEISLSAVGSILTIMEILQAFAFFCTIWHLKRRLKAVLAELSKDVTSVTDYAVMIRNLPKDTTEEELIAHFSNLYPLDKPDWKNRPVLNGAAPVQEVRGYVSVLMPSPYRRISLVR
jgi:hypothetical protein